VVEGGKRATPRHRYIFYGVVVVEVDELEVEDDVDDVDVEEVEDDVDEVEEDVEEVEVEEEEVEVDVEVEYFGISLRSPTDQ